MVHDLIITFSYVLFKYLFYDNIRLKMIDFLHEISHIYAVL